MLSFWNTALELLSERLGLGLAFRESGLCSTSDNKAAE